MAASVHKRVVAVTECHQWSLLFRENSPCKERLALSAACSVVLVDQVRYCFGLRQVYLVIVEISALSKLSRPGLAGAITSTGFAH